ncbi:FAST kinase domain-containing protein 1%2C mitochondrial [Xyrichtys novacula]|uniref:FAST kinase domain-containing protein 1, mitochondrial n=1 Tax=Xyrichtys novacula TaxID=13765 RepID=A0AAV1H0R0_XYRNO|nr:FAST kinase domain-containing protein 1%2C mitochondrial [Xyrichtys novacula]
MRMLRLRCVNSHFRRLLHWAPVTSDHVMEQLKVCKAEDEVFDVVSKNKAKLTVDHINQAMKHLWNFETPKPQPVRNLELTKKHPQFLTLRVLAENKIYYMDSAMLVDMLYRFLRFNVEPHDSLVQQMVSEVWLRLDRLPLSTLSKFAVCLSDQNLHHSPLMGRITHIVDQKLSTIDDARILTTLMIYLSALMSPRLHHAFITRADLLLDTMDQSCYNNARRVLQFMRNTKYNDRPLLEKCNKIILSNITKLYVEDISIIVGLYQSLQFSNYAFRLAAKQRLIELIDSCPDPFSFPLLFYALGPMASDKIRERLENTAFLLADEFNAQQALAIAETLVEAQSRNLSLVNKIASVIQRNLHIYRPLELVKITQAFTTLKYQNPDFLTKITAAAVNFLQRSVLPHEAVILTRILSMLPCPRLEEGIISRVEALVPQCTLNDLNQIAQHVAKWVHNEPSYIYNTPGKFVHLLQTMNRCGHERLQTADRLDLLVEELKYVSGEWYEETQMEETMVTLKRMMDQMNWKVLPELTQFLFRMSHLNPPLMDQIANVAIKDIDKIQPSVMYAILLPFSVLNYDSEQTDELFDKCIQRITSTHLRSLDPQMLVSLAHIFAVGNSFPEELIREIFSIDFLGKLDTHLESMAHWLQSSLKFNFFYPAVEK